MTDSVPKTGDRFLDPDESVSTITGTLSISGQQCAIIGGNRIPFSFLRRAMLRDPGYEDATRTLRAGVNKLWVAVEPDAYDSLVATLKANRGRAAPRATVSLGHLRDSDI